MKTGRIALFGGAFDPFHNGHLAVCRAAAERLGPDRLIVIPTFDPPHKGELGASYADRFAMTLAALEGTGFAVSDYEGRRGGVSYSAETVEDFARMYPNSELYFVIGGDSYAAFNSWFEPWRITAKATLAVYPRNGFAAEPAAPAVSFDAGRVDISSTELRRRLAAGEGVGAYVPEAVSEYIKEHKLYTDEVL